MENSCCAFGRVKVEGKEYTLANEGIPQHVYDVAFHEELPNGIYLFVYEDGNYVETQYISHYNTNLFHPEELEIPT